MADNQGSTSKSRLLAREEGTVRIDQCACENHIHLTIGATRITVALEEFFAVARAVEEAGLRLGDEDPTPLTSQASSLIQ